MNKERFYLMFQALDKVVFVLQDTKQKNHFFLKNDRCNYWVVIVGEAYNLN